MTRIVQQIGRSPFKPLTSFLAYATGEEEVTERTQGTEMQKMTIKEFHEALKAQGVSGHEHFAFVCPVCSTVQSGADLMRATGKPFEEIERSLAFSCVGRFTDAGPFKAGKKSDGCNWTLGGFFRLHKLVVIDEDGSEHPRFELATPEQAQQHEQANRHRDAA